MTGVAATRDVERYTPHEIAAPNREIQWRMAAACELLPRSSMHELTSVFRVFGCIALLGCGGSADSDATCSTGKCDDIDDPNAACVSLQNDTGRDVARGDLKDPLSALVLGPGDRCPTTYSAIMQKIAENQSGCSGKWTSDTASMVVSEEAQNGGVTLPNGDPASYRIVTTRTCNQNEQHHLFLSVIAQGGASVDDLDRASVEIIGLDTTSGVFNFYKTEDDGWHFKGNSTDMLGDGECGACHSGGGLVMKELHSPWIYWEEPTGVATTPGLTELFESTSSPIAGGASLLGDQDPLAGLTLESLVRRGNRQWNPARVQHLVETATVKELLQPLFCTVEINLDNMSRAATPIPTLNIFQVPHDLLLDPRLQGLTDPSGSADGRGGVRISKDDYTELLQQTGQVVPILDTPDTILPLIFPERAEIDHAYVLTLVEQGVLDDDFVLDVLAVDFTRPIFSSDRCALLDLAPDVLVANLPGGATPDAIRQAFVDRLRADGSGATSPAGVLLSHLETSGDAAAHEAAAKKFTQACGGRDQRAFLENVLEVVAHTRSLAREPQVLHGFRGNVIENPIQLPVDNLAPDAGVRFHPDTCELTTSFVTPTP